MSATLSPFQGARLKILPYLDQSHAGPRVQGECREKQPQPYTMHNVCGSKSELVHDDCFTHSSENFETSSSARTIPARQVAEAGSVSKTLRKHFCNHHGSSLRALHGPATAKIRLNAFHLHPKGGRNVKLRVTASGSAICIPTISTDSPYAPQNLPQGITESC